MPNGPSKKAISRDGPPSTHLTPEQAAEINEFEKRQMERKLKEQMDEQRKARIAARKVQMAEEENARLAMAWQSRMAERSHPTTTTSSSMKNMTKGFKGSDEPPLSNSSGESLDDRLNQLLEMRGTPDGIKTAIKNYKSAVNFLNFTELNPPRRRKNKSLFT